MSFFGFSDLSLEEQRRRLSDLMDRETNGYTHVKGSSQENVVQLGGTWPLPLRPVLIGTNSIFQSERLLHDIEHFYAKWRDILAKAYAQEAKVGSKLQGLVSMLKGQAANVGDEDDYGIDDDDDDGGAGGGDAETKARR